jgi:hypothetical protein
MNTKLSSTLPLLPGETPLPKAPAVVLDDGTNCIPQHFLSYQHSKESVAAIVAEIDFDPKYVLFVDEDNASIFIQVGIIGRDNYVAFDTQEAEKIVYGRRWRVESQLPSSEIIQTAFLALKKAREHEIRELFKCKTQYQVSRDADNHENSYNTTTTTPFSCHHDLPLIAMGKANNTSNKQALLTLSQMQECCDKITYDYAKFSLQDFTALPNGQYLLALYLETDKRTQLPELISLGAQELPSGLSHIIIDSATEDGLKYGLIDFVLQLSNRFSEENFTFKGFARFSRKQSIDKISALSAKTRLTNNSHHDSDFVDAFASANYETDTTRVPKISPGGLGDKIKKQLKNFDIKYGMLPKNES